MSTLIAGVEARFSRAKRVIQRMALAPTLVRLVILVAGTAAMLLAFPPVAPLLLAILLPVLFPRGFAATFFIVLTVFMWLVNTTVNTDAITWWRVAALAYALYLVHVTSALAAVLPYDSVLTPGVFRPWILRAAAVGVLTAVVSIFVFGLSSVFKGGHEYVAATVGGLVVLITTAIFLAYLGNRRQ
jgi:hypothetical protein